MAQLVARTAGGREVAGSSPVTPTTLINGVDCLDLKSNRKANSVSLTVHQESSPVTPTTKIRSVLPVFLISKLDQIVLQKGECMPPRFKESSFKFNHGESIPEHIEEYPGGAQDPAKYHLNGFDTFDEEDYPLAKDIDDLPTAQMLYFARLRHLEANQPSVSSGGQRGIQDKVLIVHPISTQ